MRKVVRIILCCIMGVYLLFGGAKLVSDALSSDEKPVKAISATSGIVETQPRIDSGYIVKEVSGKIAVEDISTGKIIRTTDTRVSVLPEEDRAQLKDGISVKTKSELRSVLEDFCS